MKGVAVSPTHQLKIFSSHPLKVINTQNSWGVSQKCLQTKEYEQLINNNNPQIKDILWIKPLDNTYNKYYNLTRR